MCFQIPAFQDALKRTMLNRFLEQVLEIDDEYAHGSYCNCSCVAASLLRFNDISLSFDCHSIALLLAGLRLAPTATRLSIHPVQDAYSHNSIKKSFQLLFLIVRFDVNYMTRVAFNST